MPQWRCWDDVGGYSFWKDSSDDRTGELSRPLAQRARDPGRRRVERDQHDRRDTNGAAEPRSLFWPWFGANVSVLGISYGSFVLGFGISAGQAIAVGVIGIVVSFALCGFISLAGKRGSAPTMVLSRAAFGVARQPAAVGRVVAADRGLGDRCSRRWPCWPRRPSSPSSAAGGGTATKIVALIVVAAMIVASGVAGFAVIMRLQVWITVITGVLTVVYVILVLGHVDLGAVAALPGGPTPAVIGALDLHDDRLRSRLGQRGRRLLPLSAPERRQCAAVVGWTTFGAALGPDRCC